MKKSIRKIVGCLCAIALITTQVIPLVNNERQVQAANDIVSEGVYKIVNASTGKCIDVPNGADENFLKIRTWEDNGATAERFKFVTSSAGYYNIIPMCAPTKRLDNPSGSNEDGTVYQLYQSNGMTPQEFSIEKTSDGYVKIINRKSGKALADVSGNLVQMTKNDSYNQKWLVIKSDCSDEMFKAAKLPGQGSVIYNPTLSGSNADLTYYAGTEACSPRYINNTLSFSSGNANKIIAANQNFANFVVEADIKIMENSTTDSNQGGILFRASNGQTGVSDGYNGYYFGLDAKNDQVMLGKVNGNTWTRIAYKNMYIRYGKYYHVQVSVSGNEIECYVNYDGTNYAKIVATDNDFGSGSVGLRQWKAPASYKNLKVSSFVKPAANGATYKNTVLGACADPDVMLYNGVYYLYATNTTGANKGFKVYASTDLTNWTDMGWCLTKENVYGNGGFWAPDLVEKNGKFYMYYVADEHLSVAVADNPLGPFTQSESERVPMHEGKEIDAHVFKDDDGQYYIYFVRFGGNSGNGNYIYGAKLNSDMRTMDDSTITCLLSPTVSWERDKYPVNEGPFMLKKDGVYYLTYSGAHFESAYYGSGYATSTSPLGTFKKYANNPIMQSNTLVHGAGHHGIVESQDGKEMFIVYHCHSSLTATEPRRLCIDRIHFSKDENGYTVLEVQGPTITPQAIPSGVTSDYGNQLLKNINATDLNNASMLTGNVNLPGKVDGVSISWSSSDNSIISVCSNGNNYTGIITRGMLEKQATLTASITVGGKTYKRNYTVTVKRDDAYKAIANGIEVNGYQISTSVKGIQGNGGFRTVYSVEPEINGKKVVSSGLIYSIKEFAGNKDDMYVGSKNYYVHNYASTEKGKMPVNVSTSSSATSYAMTMMFVNQSPLEYIDTYSIRAYAELEDGTYVYSETYDYTIYDIANVLYTGNQMRSEAAHDYLYENILKRVNPDYTKIDYKIEDSIVRG